MLIPALAWQSANTFNCKWAASGMHVLEDLTTVISNSNYVLLFISFMNACFECK